MNRMSFLPLLLAVSFVFVSSTAFAAFQVTGATLSAAPEGRTNYVGNRRPAFASSWKSPPRTPTGRRDRKSVV